MNGLAVQEMVSIVPVMDSATQGHMFVSVTMDGLEKDAIFLTAQGILIAVGEVSIFISCNCFYLLLLSPLIITDMVAKIDG